MPLIQPFLLPLVGLSSLGLVLSLIVHMCSLLGFPSPLGEQAWILHVGIFVVWFPAVIVMQALTKEFKQKDLWRAALRGCPSLMRRMTYGFGAYALINFAIFLMLVSGHDRSAETPAAIFRGFSGHWMAFYSAALAILYSALHAEERDDRRRCLAGHRVSPTANYCEECGQPVHEVPKRL